MQNINFNEKMTNYRWIICAMLFFATTVNYLDRQVLSLTWDEFIKPEFHWDESNYGRITSIFSIFYAVCMLFAGRFVDWMGTKKGYLWAIGVWSPAPASTPCAAWAPNCGSDCPMPLPCGPSKRVPSWP